LHAIANRIAHTQGESNMKTKITLLALATSLQLTQAVQADVQSVFRAPVNLKVWQHYQPSWNVENVSAQNHLVEVERGYRADTPYLQIRYKSTLKTLTAEVGSEAYVPEGQWDVKTQSSPTYKIPLSRLEGPWAVFELFPAPEFVDSPHHQIVTKIRLKVLSDSGVPVYQQEFLPMYVRSQSQNYWTHKIPAYNAHAGEGNIAVSKLTEAEKGFDRWDGVLVKPVLNFVDRDTLSAGSVIGLHRHEHNQEMYLLESGRAVMSMGVAEKIAGSDHSVMRKWSENGETQEVPEFEATGGWIEERVISSAELTVIVPNHENANRVTFHGITALSDSVLWTLGTKN
jgi:mannose-6-phosphate isomerase-like protein (cupin superfamily)